jgi:hypothetical protein
MGETRQEEEKGRVKGKMKRKMKGNGTGKWCVKGVV